MWLGMGWEGIGNKFLGFYMNDKRKWGKWRPICGIIVGRRRGVFIFFVFKRLDGYMVGQAHPFAQGFVKMKSNGEYVGMGFKRRRKNSAISLRMSR